MSNIGHVKIAHDGLNGQHSLIPGLTDFMVTELDLLELGKLYYGVAILRKMIMGTNAGGHIFGTSLCGSYQLQD